MRKRSAMYFAFVLLTILNLAKLWSSQAPWPRKALINLDEDNFILLPETARELSVLAYQVCTLLKGKERITANWSTDKQIPRGDNPLISWFGPVTDRITIKIKWLIFLPEGRDIMVADFSERSISEHTYPNIKCGGFAGCVPNPAIEDKKIIEAALADGVADKLHAYFIEDPIHSIALMRRLLVMEEAYLFHVKNDNEIIEAELVKTNGAWHEKQKGIVIFVWNETSRDNEYIYLVDKSRGFRLAIPIQGGISKISDSLTGEWQNWNLIKRKGDR